MIQEVLINPSAAPGVAETTVNNLANKPAAKPERRGFFRWGKQPAKPKDAAAARQAKQAAKQTGIKQLERVNRAANGQHVEFASLAKLEYGLQWFENLIHILAPRLLIVGFVFSMVDLLTRGNLLNNGVMVYTWAIIQAMAIDATLPNMWRLAWLRFDEKRWFAGGVLLIVAIALAGVVLAALSIQFLQQSTGANLDRTMASLGIDPSLLSYVRSIAVVALAAILSVLNRSKITSAKQPRVATPAAPPVNEQGNSESKKPAEINTDEHKAVNIPARRLHPVALLSVDGPKQDGDKLARIKDLLLNTEMGVTEIANAVGVTKGYVSQVKSRLNAAGQ